MDIPVLKYVDVLIGLSLVMLLLATAAVTISQAALNFAGSRAKHLAIGLEQLIRQIHPRLLDQHAKAMAEQVLRHPLVCQPSHPLFWPFQWAATHVLKWFGKTWPPSIQPGAVILREEFAVCLFEWASGEGAWAATWQDADAAARQKAVAEALKQRGIEDPATTLKAFRLQAMKNEQEHPEQSAQLWRSQALAQCAPSDFLATLYQTFDTSMNRATATFGSEAQVWVSIAALLVVVALQIDALRLIQRLSADEKYRESLVTQANRLVDKAEEAKKAATTANPPATAAPPITQVLLGTDCDTLKDLDKERCQVNASLNLLHDPAIDIWPRTHWWEYKEGEARKALSSALPGMVVAWLLVSLGAPFWFDAIKNLFKLRSLIAQKDDADRTQRETAQSAEASTAGANAGVKPPAMAGAAMNGAASPGANSPGANQLAGNAGNGQGANGTPAESLAFGGEMGDLSATGAQG